MAIIKKDGKKKDHLLMEKILADISASLVAPKNLDEVISTALEEIGRYLNLSRVYMMQVRLPENLFDNTHEWCSPGVVPRQSQLWGIPSGNLPKWMDPLRSNENIVIPEVKSGQFDTSFASPFEIPKPKALLIVPIWAHGQLYGFIGFENLSQPIHWKDEQILTLRMIAEIFRRSISAYHTEKELRKTRDQLEAVFNCIADPLNVLDLSYTVLMCNPARATILNMKVEDIIGRKCYEVFHNRATPCIACAVTDAFQTGQPSYRLRCRKNQDGSEVWSDVFAFPIYNDKREMIQAVEFARDITQRKAAEDEIRKLYASLEQEVEERTQELKSIQGELLLKEKLALIGQLIGSVGHEFRSSLTILSGTLYLLKNREESNNMDELVEALEEEVHKMSKFVEDLLDFSRTTSPSFQRVDLKRILERLVNKIMIPPDIRVVIDFPEPLAPAFVDADHAEQIFQNLISNASEAMPSGGTLTIKAQEQSGKIVLSFTDTGVGIPPINLRRIFTPLFTTKSKGTGLGLSIVNMLIHKNKGKVTVDSVPNQGTTFRLYFPQNLVSDQEAEPKLKAVSDRDQLKEIPPLLESRAQD